ncbi:MAG: carboxypeptidase regulatory-like domain-containing protein [Lachnospiraceae bacterium]|nr:carboxypeptidase regulatory-like domain-containing protein [Lachnospiraceae bacterium]
MKKLINITLLLAVSILPFSCDPPEPDPDPEDSFGGIYGMVTDSETGEAIRTTEVQLFYDGKLLTSSVTYEDGHFEFNHLYPGSYRFEINKDNYQPYSYSLIVQSSYVTKVDVLLHKRTVDVTVVTENPTISESGIVFKGKHSSSSSNIRECGFYYGTDPNPKDKGTLVKSSATYSSFDTEIDPLPDGKYYVQAYATNYVGTAYGEVKSFTCSAVRELPEVRTIGVTQNNSSSTTISGEIISNGSPAYTEKGFILSQFIAEPTIHDNTSYSKKYVEYGSSKTFSSVIRDLENGKFYHARAYAISDEGVSYGATVTFKAGTGVDWYELGNLAVLRTDSSTGMSLEDASARCQTNVDGGVYYDWRLPTVAEAKFLYENRVMLGMAGYTYWTEYEYTSDDYSTYNCYSFNMATGKSTRESSEYKLHNVRYVRTIMVY